MKGKELKNKDIKELSQVLSELRSKLARFSFELEASTLKNVSEVGENKKDIARVLTEITSRKK